MTHAGHCAGGNQDTAFDVATAETAPHVARKSNFHRGMVCPDESGGSEPPTEKRPKATYRQDEAGQGGEGADRGCQRRSTCDQ